MRSIWAKTAKERPMAATAPPVALGASAPDFRLPATDGRTYSFADVAGKHGTVIVFICNHCPYVKALIDRMVADARTLLAEGFGFAAICSNDAKSYPEDSFANMQRFAKTHDFPFPYLHDEDQTAARAYGAVCTPDFFGLRRGAQAEISRPPRRGAHECAARRRPQGAPRCDARDRSERRDAQPAARLD